MAARLTCLVRQIDRFCQAALAAALALSSFLNLVDGATPPNCPSLIGLWSMVRTSRLLFECFVGDVVRLVRSGSPSGVNWWFCILVITDVIFITAPLWQLAISAAYLSICASARAIFIVLEVN